MKIYIASSWKNKLYVRMLAYFLRKEGHEVDCFADDSSGRYVFHWSEMPVAKENPEKLNAISFLRDSRTKKAFKEDKKWLDWCDVCLLCLPAGNSAHLEAGYAVGCGKKLVIFHLSGFPQGEFDVMYGFAYFLTDDFVELLKAL